MMNGARSDQGCREERCGAAACPHRYGERENGGKDQPERQPQQLDIPRRGKAERTRHARKPDRLLRERRQGRKEEQ